MLRIDDKMTTATSSREHREDKPTMSRREFLVTTGLFAAGGGAFAFGMYKVNESDKIDTKIRIQLAEINPSTFSTAAGRRALVEKTERIGKEVTDEGQVFGTGDSFEFYGFLTMVAASTIAINRQLSSPASKLGKLLRKLGMANEPEEGQPK